jgi:hypothetical protein
MLTQSVTAPRNRIKRHVRVRAGDLVPHELNPRLHPDAQRAALAALYREVGFSRSLLAYELPDGRLKLIDGHLRRSLTPDMEVEVEVLDVTEAEARTLLLSLDPLAQLADTDPGALEALRGLTHTDSDALANLWESLAHAAVTTEERLAKSRQSRSARDNIPEQFLVLVECAGEREQAELLERFRGEGLRCKALLS